MPILQEEIKGGLQVYVSDKPQRHNQVFLENIKPEIMIAPLYSGRILNKKATLFC